MHEWLSWAEGPAFRFALALMVLGLGRLLLLAVLDLALLRRRGGAGGLHLGPAWRESLGLLLPFRRPWSGRPLYTLLTVVFHLCLLVVPLFLGAHLLLLEGSTGLAWPALDQGAADLLTLTALAAGALVLLYRVSHRPTRQLTRFQDLSVLLLLLAVFGTGWLAAHPGQDPLPHPATRLAHVLAGNLLLVLVPFTKLSHMVLLPLTRAATRASWHLEPGAGARVGRAMGLEEGGE